MAPLRQALKSVEEEQIACELALSEEGFFVLNGLAGSELLTAVDVKDGRSSIYLKEPVHMYRPCVHHWREFRAWKVKAHAYKRFCYRIDSAKISMKESMNEYNEVTARKWPIERTAKIMEEREVRNQAKGI